MIDKKLSSTNPCFFRLCLVIFTKQLVVFGDELRHDQVDGALVFEASNSIATPVAKYKVWSLHS